MMTWRRGYLWGGFGTDGTKLWEGGQAQRLVFHMLASKLLPSFAKLESTDHLRRLAAHAYEFKVAHAPPPARSAVAPHRPHWRRRTVQLVDCAERCC